MDDATKQLWMERVMNVAGVIAWQVYAAGIASYQLTVRVSHGLMDLHSAVRDQQYLVGQQLLDNVEQRA